MKTNICFIIIFFLIITACSEVVEYSPYDSNVKDQELNIFYTENLNSLNFDSQDTLTFALLSDSHFYYDELRAAVKSINRQKGISFVVICGDITDSGLAKEYECYLKQVRKLRYPFVSVIGNHDYLSNGGKVYEKMFGPSNFSFLCGNYKFIVFDNVVWENINKTPDFEWLNKEVEISDNKCVLLSHIPPWTDQFTEDFTNKFYSIANKAPVLLSVHGHQHHYQDTVITSKRFFVTEAVFEREYYLVHLIGEKVEIEKVTF